MHFYRQFTFEKMLENLLVDFKTLHAALCKHNILHKFQNERQYRLILVISIIIIKLAQK